MAAFRPTEHIRRRSDFKRVYEQGARIRGHYSTIFLLPTALDFARLGIAATKKLGGSVTRNRAKRLIREVFRRNKITKGLDIVVVPKREMLIASLVALEEDYRRSLASGSRRR